jgi:hypothetical protein
MQLARLWLASWGVGLLSYIGFLALVFRQTISTGDLPSVIVSSLLAYGLAFLLIYLPLLAKLRRLLGGVHPAWSFPVMAMLLGILPTALIALFWGGSLHALFQSESLLFIAMFAGAGVTLGLGYVRIHRKVA